MLCVLCCITSKGVDKKMCLYPCWLNLNIISYNALWLWPDTISSHYHGFIIQFPNFNIFLWHFPATRNQWSIGEEFPSTVRHDEKVSSRYDEWLTCITGELESEWICMHPYITSIYHNYLHLNLLIMCLFTRFSLIASNIMGASKPWINDKLSPSFSDYNLYEYH